MSRRKQKIECPPDGQEALAAEGKDIEIESGSKPDKETSMSGEDSCELKYRNENDVKGDNEQGRGVRLYDKGNELHEEAQLEEPQGEQREAGFEVHEVSINAGSVAVEMAQDESKSEKSGLEIDIRKVIEAILFATDEPVTPHKLVDIVGCGGVKEIKEHIKGLNSKYEQMACVFRIEYIADGYQMLTLSEFNPWLSKLIKVRSESKLTPAALETLAIVAYKQPIMRAEVENIRGVAAGEMIRQLIDKGLVKITGRAEELGRPLLYGTTRKFLEIFGLGTLKDLPNSDEDKNRQRNNSGTIVSPAKNQDSPGDNLNGKSQTNFIEKNSPQSQSGDGRSIQCEPTQANENDREN